MGKLTGNEVRHLDKIQEALEELKKPKFANLGEYGKYLKSLSNPTRDQQAIIVYSILDMIEAHKAEWGVMSTEKLTAIMAPIGKETGIELGEMLRILMHLLMDASYFLKIAKEFRQTFEANSN